MLKYLNKSSQNIFLAAGAGVVLTALTFLLIWMLFPKTNYIYTLFFERGWVQYIITFFFWVVMLMLVFKQIINTHESRGVERIKSILKSADLNSTFIYANADLVRDKFIDDAHQAYRDTRVFARIVNALDRLRKTQSTRAFEDYFRTRSDIDSQEMDSSYATIRYFAWLIPTLGFIGTVMGIGLGIKGFADIIARSEDVSAIKAVLPQVTTHLGTAFDTTLLALGLSTVVIYYLSLIQKQEERLLEEIDNLSIDGVCPLFREHSGDAESIVKALGENIQHIRNSMNGNRAEIEKVIRIDLPKLFLKELTQGIGNTLANFGRQMDDLTRVTGAMAALLAANNRSGKPESPPERETPPDPPPENDLFALMQRLTTALENNNRLRESNPRDGE